MKRLFIVGNGFDLDHSLKTSFRNFRDYLVKAYPDAYREIIFCSAPEPGMLSDGSDEFDQDEVVNFLINLIDWVSGGDWSDFESHLGNLNYGEYLADKLDYIDKEGDTDYPTIYKVNEDLSKNLVFPIMSVISLFNEWIDTIDILSGIEKKEDFEGLITRDSIFFTFNYTFTLEDLYDIDDVMHIHGEVGEDLIVGHGSDSDISERDEWSHYGAEGSIQYIHDSLRKNTSEIIENNGYFFLERCINIEEIYSYGFSFSNVDLPYITEICKYNDTRKIIWFLNSYGLTTESEKYFKEKIRKCGFQGTFKVYSIDK